MIGDEHIIIIGIDPGNTTGLFRYDTYVGTSMHAELEDVTATVDWIRARTDVSRITEIAMERFIIGTRTVKATRQPRVFNVIGAVKQLCVDLNVPCHLQSASEAKVFAPNDQLRRLGWYARGHRHANDAARHALLLLAQSHRHEFELLVS